MSMEKVLGTELATGVTATGLTGVHEQSGTNASVGELKTYKNKDGVDISVYANDVHKEISFEALIESSAEDHEVGDVVTIGGVSGVVMEWNVVESNEDVKKVNGKIRTYPDISVTPPSPDPDAS